MSEYILHHDGKFILWSTIVDAPVMDFALAEADFRAYYLERFGSHNIHRLADRLDRAIAKGSSAFGPSTFDSEIVRNHAGPDGTCLTKAQIIARFFTDIEHEDIIVSDDTHLRAAAFAHGGASFDQSQCPFIPGTIYYDDWHDGFGSFGEE